MPKKISPSDVIQRYEKMLQKQGDTLSRLLYFAQRNTSLQFFELLKQQSVYQLSTAHIHILQMLCLTGMNIKVLSESLMISKQAVSRSVDELEDLGYVKKIRDSEDSRSKRVIHTSKGLKAVNDIITCSETIDEALENKFGRAKYQAFKKTLTELADGL